jgi:hypothetical protein
VVIQIAVILILTLQEMVVVVRRVQVEGQNEII